MISVVSVVVSVLGVLVVVVILVVAGSHGAFSGLTQADPKKPRSDAKTSQEVASTRAPPAQPLTGSDSGVRPTSDRLKPNREKDAAAAPSADDAPVVLQAPALDKTDPAPIRAFTEQLRNLAEGGTKSPYPPATIFQTVFDQNTVALSKSPAVVLGRNVIVQSGTFDESRGKASWEFYLWYHFMGAVSDGDVRLPEDADVCVVKATFDQTAAEAQRWKESYDNGTLKVELRYRIESVKSRRWQEHLRLPGGKDFLPGGQVLSHDIVFVVNVLAIERMPASAPSPAPTTPKQSERDRLLAEVEKKYRQVAADEDAKMQAYNRAKAQFDIHNAADPGNPALFPEINRLGQMLGDYKRQLDKDEAAYDQEVRKIIRDHPMPGDPKLIDQRGVLYTQEEYRRVQAERLHRDPQKLAESHILELMSKNVVSSATYRGITYYQKDKGLAAVSYQIDAVVQGRTFRNQLVYVTVQKDGDFWQIVLATGEGIELSLGRPPAGLYDAKGAGAPVINVP